MSAAAPPGAARGDRSVYVGRKLIGTIRGSTAGVIAFDHAGKRLGAFQSHKAAMAALTGSMTSAQESAS